MLRGQSLISEFADGAAKKDSEFICRKRQCDRNRHTAIDTSSSNR